MSVLVIGGNGQLGRHLREELPEAQFWDRAVVDLTDIGALQRKLAEASATAIVNATAYTAVDKAESEPDEAWCVNAEAPAAMARAARRLGVPFIHVSTDYVFDGTKAAGYVESDATAPLNVYGRSKLGGELAAGLLCPQHWILRASWVFSEHGNNFPKTMLRLARDRDELRVVEDQRGRPTYAGDLARCIAALLTATRDRPRSAWGVHHVGGGPVISWKQFAERIVGEAAASGQLVRAPSVVGIRSEEYPTPAARPRNSLLLTRAETSPMNGEFDWERGLRRMLAALA